MMTSVPMPAPVYRAMAPVQTTVQTPVAYTQYVNQPVTRMVPVTRRQTTQVPSVQYRTVTQYQTRNRDMGRWVTQYTPNRRLSPCQVDPRPGFGGWMNRTGYELRNMFTPQYTTRRQYVPNVVAQTVPVTRRVAVPTTRAVAYNVTQMVPQTVNQQVAVNRVRYVTQNMTSLPTLAMQPAGFAPSVAWAPTTVGAVAWDPFGGSLAAAPVAESVPYDQMAVMTENEFERRTAMDLKMDPVPDRTVPRTARRDSVEEGLFGEDDDEFPVRSNRRATDNDGKRPYEKDPHRSSEMIDDTMQKSSFRTPMRQQARTPVRQPPAAARDFDDGFYPNDDPSQAQPRTTAPPRAAVAPADGGFDDDMPSFDDSGSDGDFFEDAGFGDDDGVDFGEGKNASRNRYTRPTAMRRSPRTNFANNDGWSASRTSTRSLSHNEDRNHKTILVSNQLP